MAITCTRCKGTGFLNSEQLEELGIPNNATHHIILEILNNCTIDHDVYVCDCCGDGETWYGVPGEHYNSEDPAGNNGPYAYNGGLCECH